VRVLHVHKLRGVGGSENHLLALLPALRARGLDARFLGLDDPEVGAPGFYAELDRLGVPFRQLRCGADVSPRMAREVKAVVREEAPDLLHTHLVHADVYGAFASRSTGVPFVSSRHNDDRYLLGPFRFVDRAFARRALRLIAISNAVRRFLIEAGHPAEKIETIHYGLDALPDRPSEVTPDDAGVPADAPLLLAIGRLTPQKDHATMLEAFGEVHAHRPEAVLAILGIGPLEAETRAAITRLGLDGAVVLPGRVEIRDWLERASIFVHTARWEGFGLVLLEAMLAALPVVATRVSAVPEVVAEGRTGLLVEPGDATALADALDVLLAHPARARRLGEAGLERARSRFSVARMADRTAALYASNGHA
jgi:glycosyltransferase involved in cell wall biosynthesis